MQSNKFYTLVIIIVLNSKSAKRWIWVNFIESDGLGWMVSLTFSGQYCSHFCTSASTNFVNMTTIGAFWSQTICQKSFIVSGSGPVLR